MSCDDWTALTPQGAVPLGEMPPWDYTTPLHLRSEVVVDLVNAFRLCGLDDATGAPRLGVVATAACRDTLWRSASTVEVDQTRVAVQLDIPPGVVARSVRLTRRLVVIDPGGGRDPLAPGRGHVVDGFDDGTTVALEGDGGRFPTQAMSFGEVGMPADAPWHLSLTYEDPGDSFAGSVQLLLNTDHPDIRTMIDPASDPVESEALRGLLSADIARQLVMRAIADERMGPAVEWGEESVGASLEALCARTDRRDVRGCRSAHQSDAGRFETELKAAFGWSL